MKDLYLTTNNLYNIPIIFENENNVESVLYEYKYSYVLKIFNTDDIATLFKLTPPFREVYYFSVDDNNMLFAIDNAKMKK